MFSPPPKKTYGVTNSDMGKVSKRKSRSEIPQTRTFDRTEVLIPSLHIDREAGHGQMFDETRGFSNPRGGNTQVLVGQSGRMEYIDSFRNIHRLQALSFESQNTPVNSYLQKVNEKHLSPVPMGMVKSKGKTNVFEIGMYGMGDNYAEAFSEGISKLSIKKLDLNDNRLTECGAKRILEKISPEKLVELNFSNNKLHKNNFTQIHSIIGTRQSILKVLKLEGLQMKDDNCEIICKALTKSNCIIEVNLAKNLLEGSKKLSKFIKLNQSVQKLDLHWNNIRGEQAVKLCRSLEFNKSIRILDLSWNALSSPIEKNCAKHLGNSLKLNKTLVHLDISHNAFSTSDIEQIGAGLNENHELLGLHISGNFGTVDDLGFLLASKERRPTSAHRFKRILGISRVNKHLGWRPCSNCWLCERWNQVEFTWESDAVDPVYVHFGFEEFDGELMVKADGKYKLQKMCPPGKFYFAFTHDGELKINPKELMQALPDAVEKEFQVYEGKVVNLVIQQVNVVENNPKGPDWMAVDEGPPLKPRVPRGKYLHIAKKKEWGIPISIFKDYKFDSPELLSKCFEYDWSHSRIARVVKDAFDLQKIKSYLSGIYTTLKEIYKYYSSISPQGEIWSIGQMVFTDLCNEAKIVDSTFRLSDLDFHMKGALYSEVRNPRSPPNALVRFQFMEILVRIALDKYYKSGQAATYLDAVQMIMEVNIFPNLSHLVADKWRFERYINEQCDIVLKANRLLLKNIYGRHSVKKVKPGQKPFMCLSEFDSIVMGADLINESFTVREICLAFNLAMMTQVQELDVDRQYQMNFVEFLEAFSRVADMAKVQDPVSKEKPDGKTHLSVILGFTIPRLIELLPLNLQKEFKEKMKAM